MIRQLIRTVAILLLAAVHLAALYALLHPSVSRQYKAYYIERISTDWNTPHYSATPEQGIILSRAGLPDFVEYTYGMSVPESFGRWTDTTHGLKAGFRFNRTFTGNVCVAFAAGSSAHMLDQKAVLRFGDQYRNVTFTRQAITNQMFDFDLDRPADSLDFNIPKPMPKASKSDGRRLGIGLAWLRIYSQPCSEVPALANPL